MTKKIKSYVRSLVIVVIVALLSILLNVFTPDQDGQESGEQNQTTAAVEDTTEEMSGETDEPEGTEAPETDETDGHGPPETDEPATKTPTTAEPTTEAPATASPATEAPTTAEPTTEKETEPEDLLDPDGSYTSMEDVALYLHLYGKLPDNFITKKEAQKLGWEGGSLEPYAPGKCIGGDRFGNYEGLLPKDKSYHECDIDTLGASKRGAKRIVYSNDGYIYYTDDHYDSFELIYAPGDEPR